jgi:hypothetical protein
MPLVSRVARTAALVIGMLAVTAAASWAVAVAPSDRNARSVVPAGDSLAGRSVALFQQMWPVLQHPRCMNCHPRSDFPRQGNDRHRHTMNVTRGADDHGAVGLQCRTCHQSANQSASGVPGAPDWHLAPVRMAWEGLTMGEVCRALLDPARGGLQPTQLVAHLNTGLVRWAWAPGTDTHSQPRATPPMSHRQFVELAREWVATGAGCPQP